MATYTVENLLCWNDADADFRAWAQFIHDVFAAGNWTQTADTGQINLSTVTQPTAANEKKGYEIWAMADSLQATYPVYVRIDYGSAGSANAIGIWLTIGTGSDGAGTITGPIYTPASSAMIAGSISSGATAKGDCHGSADTDRIACALFVTNSASQILLFGIERTKDTSAQDTNSGVLLSWGTSSGALDRQILLYFDQVSPPLEQGLSYMRPYNNPSVFNSEVWIESFWVYDGGYDTFGLNWMGVLSNDFMNESILELFDGHCEIGLHYRHLWVATIIGTVTNDTGSRLCMRWD